MVFMAPTAKGAARVQPGQEVPSIPRVPIALHTLHKAPPLVEAVTERRLLLPLLGIAARATTPGLDYTSHGE